MATYKDLLGEAYAGSYRSGVPNERDCSGFVIAAAQKVGVHLPARQADGLIEYMEANWDKLGLGSDGMTAALAAARSGSFVVVGATADELDDTNGHVAVILGRVHNGWPVVYGGASNAAARTRGEKTLNYVFRREYHPALRYYAPKFVTVPAFDSE